VDTGSEFTGHVGKAVAAETYVCVPYCSGQRGNNENTNSLIRQYFHKGIDLCQVTNAEQRNVIKSPYHRPQNGSATGHRTRCAQEPWRQHLLRLLLEFKQQQSDEPRHREMPGPGVSP